MHTCMNIEYGWHLSCAGQFLPPEDIVFVKKEKSDCLSSIHSEIPRPVEELSFEGITTNRVLNLVVIS